MKIYRLVAILCLPISLSAQSVSDDKQQVLLGQGRLNVGVSVGGGYGGYVGNSGHVIPRLQYFIKDGWSIALEGRYDLNSGTQTRFTGGSLSTRYYFLRARRLALFGQAGATYGQTRYYADANGPNKFGSGSPRTANTFLTSAGLGVHYRLGNRWSMEAEVDRTVTNSTRPVLDASPWRSSIGVNFRLR